ncbi:hypothetical protein DENSPDRAFT_793771 [Dentipellis sp. KUC8613]|nr:hypothetical protein DENSPDRAFT_793771 [Dentipellis sp. KUC8613]
MAEYVTPSTIHLLPPHEHLSTDLRAIRNNGDLHVSFAWLGHGAIMHQSRAVEFLDLLQHLNATDSEFKMADNYFSLLSNIIPEVWFDQGIELGGGQAFTVGVEGDVRNKFHILQAAHYLDSLLACEDYPCDTRKKPFLHNKRSSPSSTLVDVQRAPCAGRPCLLETRMKVLPSTIVHHGEHAAEILDLEEDQRANYLGRPPSFAVDGRPATAFVSLEDAKAEDYIMLDMLTDVGHAWSDLTLVWLVPPSTQVVLSQCVFEMSLDGHAWAKSQDSLSCTEAVPIFDDAEQPLELTECSVKMNANSSAASVRFLKAYLPQDVAQRWAVHEIWVRGIRK